MLRRQKHVRTQSTTPFACTLVDCINFRGDGKRAHKNVLGAHPREFRREPPFRSQVYPDPPILAFFVFLAFFVLRGFLALFCAFLASFPGILGVQQKEKSLLFSGRPCFFCQKSKDWRVRVGCTRRESYSAKGRVSAF